MRKIKAAVAQGQPAEAAAEAEAEGRRQALASGRQASSISPAQARVLRRVVAELDALVGMARSSGPEAGFGPLAAELARKVEDLKIDVERARTTLDNVFDFCEAAFKDGDELLVLVAELTVNYHTARFIGHYGDERYQRHNRELRFHERQRDLERRVERLDWSLFDV
jgi:hypothetical protein